MATAAAHAAHASDLLMTEHPAEFLPIPEQIYAVDHTTPPLLLSRIFDSPVMLCFCRGARGSLVVLLSAMAMHDDGDKA